MLQTERVNDFQEALRTVLIGFAAGLYIARVGKVLSFNPDAGTCVIELTIQAQITDTAGATSDLTIKPISDVPVVFMGGGQFVTTYPIQPGDEALVIFADRCIDAWWQSGGVQAQAELRMHDISDGFALIGPRSQARSIPNLSTTTAQFRTLDGSTYFELAPGQVANIVAPGGVNITGPVNITGDVAITGTVNVTAEGTFNAIPVSTHVHFGTTLPPTIDTGGPTV